MLITAKGIGNSKDAIIVPWEKRKACLILLSEEACGYVEKRIRQSEVFLKREMMLMEIYYSKRKIEVSNDQFPLPLSINLHLATAEDLSMIRFRFNSFEGYFLYNNKEIGTEKVLLTYLNARCFPYDFVSLNVEKPNFDCNGFSIRYKQVVGGDEPNNLIVLTGKERYLLMNSFYNEIKSERIKVELFSMQDFIVEVVKNRKNLKQMFDKMDEKFEEETVLFFEKFECLNSILLSHKELLYVLHRLKKGKRCVICEAKNDSVLNEFYRELHPTIVEFINC